MPAEVDFMEIKKVLKHGKKRVILLPLWKRKLPNVMKKRLQPKTEKCRNFMVKKQLMLVKEMMETLWQQGLIGETLIKLILTKKIKKINPLWMDRKLIEKLERHSNYIQTSQLTLMKTQLLQELINSTMISRESVWLQMQDGMTRVDLQSLWIQENQVLSTWDNNS